MSAAPLDPWYLAHLVCPRDHGVLTLDGAWLCCTGGHRYPVIEGIPVMLLSESAPTIDILPNSVEAREQSTDPFYLDTLSLSAEEKAGIVRLAEQGGPIDPVVAYLVAATNGLMYKHLVGALATYPVPPLPLPDGHGRSLLDIGCSWGRWTLAASESGYDAVGIDPSLGAVLAARRVAAALNRPAHFIVADARYLPFANTAFDAAYSYSVIQHFSRDDAARAVHEIGRVVRTGGLVKVQMPTMFGIRCLFHQLRRGFTDGRAFDVRYWSLPGLRRLFACIGRPSFEVDGYFAIGLRGSDAELMTPFLRLVTRVSEMLRRSSHVLTPLVWVADSVFVSCSKEGDA